MFLAAAQCTDAFFVSVNPFHARHVREFALCISTGADLDHVTIVYQQDERRSSFVDADWMQTNTQTLLHA